LGWRSDYIVAIAEVVRNLHRSESQPEQSYSERQLYEAALDRLSREIAVVQHVTETEAVKEIEGQLAKSPRRGAKTEGDAVAEGDVMRMPMLTPRRVMPRWQTRRRKTGSLIETIEARSRDRAFLLFTNCPSFKRLLERPAFAQRDSQRALLTQYLQARIPTRSLPASQLTVALGHF
jgi:hypothetical protein